MAHAPSSVYFNVGDGSIRGHFIEKTHGNLFEFSMNLGETEFAAEMLAKGYKHLIWVNSSNPEPRFAKVLKTRAHVVDDAEVDVQTTTWHFKSFVEYKRG